MPKITERLKRVWNAFNSRDRTYNPDYAYGVSSGVRPDKIRSFRANAKNSVSSIYNRIAIDVAATKIEHVRLDENMRYLETIPSPLNYCLTVEANIDQTGRAFIQDVAMSLLDEGCVAIVPVVTDSDPEVGSFDVYEMRVGQIMEWFPQHVKVRVYNDRTGQKEDLIMSKRSVAIIENPLYATMNEPNSTLQRLLRKLALLDAIDEQSGSGKLDIIIQLPYVIRSEAQNQQAERRRKDIEMQLTGSKYGIAYTDGTEKITQLNRPAENNLMNQITYLTSTLYGQLGITEEVMNGTADEKTMLNYFNRTIEPILSAITDGSKRIFLTKTARTQRQSISFFRDPFRLVTIDSIANVADTFTRNEILTSNEIRGLIGFKPSSDPNADVLRNKNLSQSGGQMPGEGMENPEETTVEASPPEETEENEEESFIIRRE